MTVDIIKRNIQSVLERVNKASRHIDVVAAVKTVPSELINVAIENGITDIGENRVQEYVAKRDAVKGANWHFIGTLQRNKAKYLVGSVALIQSVNSFELACEIDKLAAKRGVVQQILLELNAAGEASKTGAPLDGFDEFLAKTRELKNITVRGLMSVPPKDAPNAVYEKLYWVFDKYKGAAFDILSVGMSGDYEKAIEFGSNMIRPGTAIFGPRL